ncbi:MAG: 23S rRNA (adenine(2503)-C(2))-methyltransferase RlmN [Parcubacteria group bacterium]|jgi:23S rRNA (adenine2503-C2)-methyltransferase|nr:23S rRNA (adenine(2503)-C(2))-methyltransferase RlmN [Candidatus Moranbacteria bacterium]
MDLKRLKKILKDEPGFRFKQMRRAVFRNFISDWDDATNISKELKEELKEKCSLEIDGEIFASKDGRTYKALINLSDGEKIEAVLIRNKDGRNSLCVSSQVGCAGACAFCATGKMGFRRNLKSDEMIDQFLFFARYLKNSFGKEEKITNVIFMGMGEPFLNYGEVMKAVHILNDENFIGLGARNISISTAGIIPGIEKLAEEKEQVNLAISLHAPDDELRSELMPVNRRYGIEKLLKAADKYIARKNRKVMFEYLLIDGVNDSQNNAIELSKIMKKPLYMVNLIPYNPTGNFRPSSREKVMKFRKILERAGVDATIRKSYGADIHAACGQLAGKNK